MIEERSNIYILGNSKVVEQYSKVFIANTLDIIVRSI